MCMQSNNPNIEFVFYAKDLGAGGSPVPVVGYVMKSQGLRWGSYPSKLPHVGTMRVWIWRLLALLGIFDSRAKIYMVFRGGKLAHYSIALSKYFSFPFMTRYDIHIGPCWTREEDRGKGLLRWTIESIIKDCQKEGSRAWYITRIENEASKAAIEKIGFERIGGGVKKKRFGVSLFGSFSIIT